MWYDNTMKQIYVVIRQRTEADDFQPVEVLASVRAFTKKENAEKLARELQADAIRLATEVTGEDVTSIKFSVVPMFVED